MFGSSPAPRLSRRIFVLGGIGAAAATALAPAAFGAAPYPFQLGIASGEPTADGVVLWTRLAPSPLDSDGHGGMPSADVEVEWQVATDDRFTKVVKSGKAVALHDEAHSVHIEVTGLAADADFFYRFRAQGHISPVGRTRTAPKAGTTARELIMAMCSCSNWPGGYFTAYRRMAEDNPGLILHLGDYIYESGPGKGPRRHVGDEIMSLADYRRRYAQYKTDPDLQAAHAVAPWLVVPDDHEVENNYAGLIPQDSKDNDIFAARRAAAYRAYWENMPLRKEQKYTTTGIPLYRRVTWGSMANFHMLDTRQFRANQACGDGWQDCADADLDTRSILDTLKGDERPQEKWLLDGLAAKTATWEFLGQQVFFARRLAADGKSSMDSWDGYRASRARIQAGFVERGIRNPIVLTGDVHAAWANELKDDYREPSSKVIGTELVTTSISSGGDGSDVTEVPDQDNNPHLKFHSKRRGYVRNVINTAQVRVDFRSIDKVSEHGAPVKTAQSFMINDGRPGLEKV
ncbi:alkaline phosphatase D family protein [Propionibacteriaceae bacterium Y1700]|uniref:alkaline phosphatase D family protein n=1 Tax=Microlunatus sp. Y1700 TaxID=3418487 RepID=UPI003DA74D31